MDPWSDYFDEMKRLTPAQIEELLAGRGADGPAARLAELVADLRRDLAAKVPSDVERRHLEAMALAGGARAETRRSAMKASS